MVDLNPELGFSGATTLLAGSVIDRRLRESDTGGMVHDGEFETSLMSFLYPALVGPVTNQTATLLDEPYEQATQDLHDSGVLNVYRRFNEYSETDAIGAPECVSAETGAVIFEEIIEAVTAVLTEVHE